MNRPKTNNHKLPRRNKDGRMRRCVGKQANGREAKITIATRETTDAEALNRLAMIISLYNSQCERSNIDYWREWTYQVALKIGAGIPIIDTCVGDERSPQHLSGIVAQLREWGIPVQVTRPDVVEKGFAIHKEQIEEMVVNLVAKEMQNKGAVATVNISNPMNMGGKSTHHEALISYSAYLEETGSRDENNNLKTRVNKCRDRVRYLQEHQEDFPLWQLNYETIEKMVAYWRNRPLTQKGKRCGKLHASDMIKEYWRFLKWLNSSPNFRWTKPNNMDEITRVPIRRRFNSAVVRRLRRYYGPI